MKHIYRLLASTILLIITAACYNEEIETPQSPDQQQSDFRITASIIQTRVAYDYSDLGKVTQEWEEGDILFGFWGGDTSNQIVFEVSDVDSNTGVATLKAVSGADWIEEATDGGTQVDLVYTGGEASFTDSGINVDLSGQSLDRVPGCMHAHATLQVDEDGNKSLEFNFQNDCALIEIDSLTGLAASGASGELESLTITNLLLGGSYSFSGGELVFESDENSLYADYDIAPLLDWTVGTNGTVSGPDGKKILIAVAPNSDEKEINVTAKIIIGSNPTAIKSEYGKRSLSGGRCYVISAKPVVAKTADGECFETVEDAFIHAKELSESGYGTAAQNVVTLIKKEINGFGEQTSADPHMDSSYDIDYNVTLDLNGCKFTLSESEGFYVGCDFDLNPSTFTITDSNGLDNQGKYIGTISSDSRNSIFENYGVVNINGGNLLYKPSDKHNHMILNYGTVNINGGFLESYAKFDEYLEEYYPIVFNAEEANLNISDGTLCSHDCDAIINIESGIVTISGGTITSEKSSAVVNYGDLTIYGGELSSSSYTIDNYAELNVFGGTVYCDSDDDAIFGNEGSKTVLRSIENEDPPLIYTMADTEDEDGIICPAIWIEDATFIMEDGIVEAKGKGAAIFLYSAGIECEISGGSVSSIDSYAVENGCDLTITGGTLTSTNSHAIYSGAGSVTVGTEDGDDEDITITSNNSTSNNPLSAIYILDGNFVMHSGTVIGANAGGAVEINGMRQYSPYGIIDGGTFISNAYHALVVSMLNTPVNTTVSGGIFKSLGDEVQSTIHVDEGYLIIQWPEDVSIPSSYDPESGIFPDGLPAVRRPLIINMSRRACPVDVSQRAPLGSDKITEVKSSVQINGGYIYACNYGATSLDTSAQNKFYKDPTSSDAPSLVLKRCGQFFSNVNSAEYFNAAPGAVQFSSAKISSGMPEVVDSSLWPEGAAEPTWYYIY